LDVDKNEINDRKEKITAKREASFVISVRKQNPTKKTMIRVVTVKFAAGKNKSSFVAVIRMLYHTSPMQRRTNSASKRPTYFDTLNNFEYKYHPAVIVSSVRKIVEINKQQNHLRRRNAVN